MPVEIASILLSTLAGLAADVAVKTPLGGVAKHIVADRERQAAFADAVAAAYADLRHGDYSAVANSLLDEHFLNDRRVSEQLLQGMLLAGDVDYDLLQRRYANSTGFDTVDVEPALRYLVQQTRKHAADRNAWFRELYKVDISERQLDTQEEMLAALQRIEAKLGQQPGPAPGPQPPEPDRPRISIAHLPATNPELFGRETELAALDHAWADPRTNVVTLVAFGGVGKTALVNHWLNHLASSDYRGADRVFGWSFYSQGAAEGRQASADQFINHALGWFGDPDPNAGSPWQKGARLAELVRRERTLLVLDGLEPLQEPHAGRVKDPALQTLLRDLAAHNSGLCVASTRLAVDDLKDRVGATVQRLDLEHLSDAAGAQLLKYRGARGSGPELEQAARDFDGHALALTLLGRYVATVHRGDIRRRDRIADLTDQPKHGDHARGVMASYARWYAGKPEHAILHLVGLFDRPADADAIAALLEEPAIAGLTDQLPAPSDDQWTFAVHALREAHLLAPPDPAAPGTLDAHPLVREHFGAELEADHPAAWRAAHSRLFDHYQARAPDQPATLEAMQPLYHAVAHGCQAGRHQAALDDVFWPRIWHGGDTFYSVKQLGAFGSDLAALAHFFDPPWRRPVDGLRPEWQSFVLNEAGFCLRALGRLAEATAPMAAGLEAQIEQEDWRNAAIAAGNLSELHLTLGEVAQAVVRAEQSVELADDSQDAFQRMSKRTTLADALHQAGRADAAAALFQEAEAMQAERQPQFPRLYSLPGYRYCDLLLAQGRWPEVVERAREMLEEGAKVGDALLDMALYNLALGRAHLQAAQGGEPGALDRATNYLDRAVDGLRAAAAQEFIVPGLLARAARHRQRADLGAARRDLDEALEIAERGQMRLFEADAHLEYARLAAQADLARAAPGDPDARQAAQAAAAHLSAARELVAQTGYARRAPEVAELEAELED